MPSTASILPLFLEKECVGADSVRLENHILVAASLSEGFQSMHRVQATRSLGMEACGWSPAIRALGRPALGGLLRHAFGIL